jgi:hypothetical protein
MYKHVTHTEGWSSVQALQLYSIHYGENILGNSFNDAHPSFEETFMKPYN